MRIEQKDNESHVCMYHVRGGTVHADVVMHEMNKLMTSHKSKAIHTMQLIQSSFDVKITWDFRV